MAAKISSLDSIAEQISANAQVISKYLAAAERPDLSFSPHQLQELPAGPEHAQIQASRMALIEQTKLLYDLVVGPAETLVRSIVCTEHDISAMSVIVRYQLDKAIPLDGEISYEEVAKISGLDLTRTRQVLRHAITLRIFQEPRYGYVQHTAASALMVHDDLIRSFMEHHIEGSVPSVGRLLESLDKWNGSTDSNKTAYNLFANTEENTMTYVTSRPTVAKRFSKAMSHLGRQEVFKDEHIIRGYDWSTIKQGGVVIDVGGGTGHMSIAIAATRPDLLFYVQDLETVGANIAIPETLANRVIFEAHNFFEPQKRSADIYLLRFVLHDWNDANAIKILRNLIPAMNNDSRIILLETVLKQPGTLPLFVEKMNRSVDMQMMVCLNAAERSAEDWEDLFSRADSRLQFKGIFPIPNSALSAIEAEFKED